LLHKLYSLADREAPPYPVIKDLFDQIDIRKDGIIDFNEWSKTFLVLPPPQFWAPDSTSYYDTSQWVHSKEY